MAAVDAAVAAERVQAEDRAVAAGHAPVVAVRAQVVVHREVVVADHAMLLPVPHRCRGRRLPTFEDRVAARAEWQTIGQRWATCRRRAIDRAQGSEIGPVEETLPIIGRT